MTVEQLTRERESSWTELVLSNPATMVYATLEFRDFLRDAVGGEPVYHLAEREGRVVGGLPTFALRGARGTVVNSLPWYGSHGGCVLADTAGDDERSALLESFAASLPDDLVSATIVLTPEETEHVGTYGRAFDATARDERVGQVTVLPEDDRQLERVVRQKTRNLVRKALRQGFDRVVTLDDWAWDFLVATHHENLRAIGGRAKPKAHFDALRRNVPADWLHLAVAKDGERPVAALLCVRFNRTVEYLTPVIEHDARARQPLSFLIWHAMSDAIRDGYRWWNWGGTWRSQTSLHHFKAGWGAEDRPYDYVITAHDPEALVRDGAAVAEQFPYYYVYPFS